MTDNLILEIYMENLPYGSGREFHENLRANLRKKLQEFEAWEERDMHGGYTCNRVTLFLSDLPANIQGQKIRIQGPRTEADEKSIYGFMRKCNCDNINDLKIEDGKYCFYRIHNAMKMKAWLQNHLPDIILNSLPTSPSCYWENSRISAPRPIRNVMCVLNGEVVSFEFAELTSNNITYDSNPLPQKSKPIDSWRSYQEFLKKSKICLDPHERRESITKQCSSLDEINWNIPDREEWLNFSADMTENPKVIHWKQDSDLPTAMIREVLYCHQKCLWLQDLQQVLFVIDDRFTDKTVKEITKKYRNSVQYRLDDAEHLLKKDLNRSWKDLQKCWSDIVIHPKLGTVQNKVDRITKSLIDVISLMRNKKINKNYFSVNMPNVSDAIWDNENKWKKLAEMMVYVHNIDRGMDIAKELTSTQRHVGYYFIQKAMKSKKPIHKNTASDDPSVNSYIRHKLSYEEKYWQYLINIVDLADTLVGLWYHGIHFTGSQDEFAQKRKINELIDNMIALPFYAALPDLIKCAARQYDEKIADDDARISEWASLIKDRILYGVLNRQAPWYWRVMDYCEDQIDDDQIWMKDLINVQDNLCIMFLQIRLRIVLREYKIPINETYKRVKNILLQLDPLNKIPDIIDVSLEEQRRMGTFLDFIPQAWSDWDCFLKLIKANYFWPSRETLSKIQTDKFPEKLDIFDKLVYGKAYRYLKQADGKPEVRPFIIRGTILKTCLQEVEMTVKKVNDFMDGVLVDDLNDEQRRWNIILLRSHVKCTQTILGIRPVKYGSVVC